MFFSIIVVCLNAGEKLHKTIDSILRQTESDYEVIVKDGCSTDGSVEKLPEDLRIRFYREKDKGIYDAMNQAAAHVRGEYVFFLNCGDCFYQDTVLEEVKKRILQIEKTGETESETRRQYVFYGNICEMLTGQTVQSNPVIDDFACYRNVPCHQACFYGADLFRTRGFDTGYKVRADYEHFLWCFYEAKAEMVYLPLTAAFYEGGGFSETKENRRISAKEHREITHKYMPAKKVRKYRWIMRLTLSGLRTKMAENPATARAYNKVKKLLYGRKK